MVHEACVAVQVGAAREKGAEAGRGEGGSWYNAMLSCLV